MLSTIRDIALLISRGSLSVKKPIKENPDLITSILIDLKQNAFCGFDLEDFDNHKVDLYLYFPDASKGNKPHPFAPITDPETTLYKKILQWVDKCWDELKDLSDEERAFLEKLKGILDENKETILSQLIEKFSQRKPAKGSKNFLTIKFVGEKEYLGEYELFKKAVNMIIANKFHASSSPEKIPCSVCGNEQKVSSDISAIADFKYATLDKPGFIMGGLNEKEAWKNIPVCWECMNLLQKGKEFIETNLKFKFYGLIYLLIPKLLISEQELENILQILSDIKNIQIEGKIKKKLTDDEREILDLIAQKNDVLTINFLFIKKETQVSKEDILLLIEDIYPSRLREIFEAKDKVDKFLENEGREFNLWSIRQFFLKSDEKRKSPDLDKYFLGVVECIFKGKNLEKDLIFNFFMNKIREEFIKIAEGYSENHIKDALRNILFFKYLHILDLKEEEKMTPSKFESIFAQYEKSFDTPEKRGIFLLGALTQALLNTQYEKRGSKPFIKKLKSLKMNEDDFRALLPEVQNKLEEYDSFGSGKRTLASEISHYFLQSGKDWKMSIDEMNFYFACGMNRYEELKPFLYTEKEVSK